MNNGTSKPTSPLAIIGIGALTLAMLSTALVDAGETNPMGKEAQAAAEARGARMKVSAPVEQPNVIAVRIRHDMCPFCQKFDPQFPKLIHQARSDAVLFVTLDLTTKDTQRQSAMMVAALGLDDVWTGDMSKMGTVTFVDGNSKEILSSVYQLDLKTVRAELRKAITATSANDD